MKRKTETRRAIIKGEGRLIFYFHLIIEKSINERNERFLLYTICFKINS